MFIVKRRLRDYSKESREYSIEAPVYHEAYCSLEMVKGKIIATPVRTACGLRVNINDRKSKIRVRNKVFCQACDKRQRRLDKLFAGHIIE